MMLATMETQFALTWREVATLLAGRDERRIWLKHGQAFFSASRIVGSNGGWYLPSLILRGRTLIVAEFIDQVQALIPHDALDAPMRATIWYGAVTEVRSGCDFALRPSFVGDDDAIFEVRGESSNL